MELITVGNCTLEATCQDGMPYVNLRRICDDLGIDYSGQLQKLKSARWAGVANISTPDKRGRPQNQAFISADTIPMWLATINANKVADEVKPILYVIQDEAKDVLNRHFINAPVANGYWFQSQPAFLQFQRLLHSTNQLDLFER